MDADSKKIYPVVFITDENYAMPTVVAITSLYYNRNEKNEYRVYVICSDVSESNIDIINSLSRNDKDFYVEAVIRDDLDRFENLGTEKVLHVSKAAIYKFELPNIFSQYDKILYLDGDMLVLNDICPLFDTDIDDRYAAVVKDYKALTYDIPQLEKLHIETKHKHYWNSGMMVLNLKKMREDNLTEKLFDYKLHGINVFMDQDALNVCFEENVRYVPFYNNIMSTLITLFPPEVLMDYYDIEEYSHYEELIRKATVLHITGRLKPWQHLIPVFSDLYKFYYSKSPYKNIPLELLDNDRPDVEAVSDEEIPVIYIVDRSTAVNTGTSIASLFYNKKPETKYKLYILCIQLEWDQLRRFNMLEAENVDVNVINITEYHQRNEYQQNGNAIKPSTLAKFEIAKLLPELDKAILIPPHSMVLKDLSDLFCYNVDEYYCGAVRDCADFARNFSLRKIINVKTYFDTSMMLLNLRAMRNSDIDKSLLLYKKYGKNNREDNDAYNAIFGDKILELPYCFNLKDNSDEYYAKYKDPLTVAGVKRYANKAELLSRAYIVEIRGKHKPWRDKVPIISDMFLRYRILSIFHDKHMKNDIDNEVEMLKNDSSYIVKRDIITGDLSYYREYDKALLPDINRELFSPGEDITLTAEYLTEKYGNSISKEGFNQEPREHKIVVSLTTVPKRVDAAALVIAIMMHQTVKPDVIVINLGVELFEGVELPELLLNEEKLGVKINYCHDLYCHTKYYHTVTTYPDDIVITVDDDIIYSETLIEELYESYQRFPNAVSAMRVHRITFNEDLSLAPYVKWNYCTADFYNKPSHKLLATGVGGVLYPPHVLPAETFNESALLRLSPKADDLWLKVMEIYNDVPVVNPRYQERLKFIGTTQEIGLCYDNVSGGQNDIQLKKIMEEYDTDKDGIPLIEKLMDPEDPIPVAIIKTELPEHIRAEMARKEAERKEAERKKAERLEAEKREAEINERIKNAVAEYDKKYLSEKHRADNNSRSINEIRTSFSYRVGKIITWLPRKIASLFSSH